MMGRDTGEPHGMSAAELRHHLSQLGWALARIEQRLTGLGTALTPATGRESGSGPTPMQWLKVLGGLALPLIVLLATGNVELARKLLAP